MKYILLALLIAFLVPAVQAQETPYADFGTDPAGDDSENAPEAGVGSELVGSSIDDIIGGGVRTNGNNLEFQILTTTSPDDEDALWNEYCWAANFEIEGQGTEYIGMMCYDYNPAVDAWVSEDTNRGEEVASSATWDEAGNALIITVPLASINANVGDVLKDIYLMTYSGGLYVDDVFPDAKTDRNAAANLGKYIIGATELGGPVVATGEVLPNEYLDTDANKINLGYSYIVPSTQTWTYNWTNMYATGNASVSAEVESGSVHFLMIDEFNTTLMDVLLEASLEQNLTFDGFGINWTVQVSFTNFQGNATMQILPDLPESSSESNGGTGGVPGTGSVGGGTGESGGELNHGNTDDESKGTPPMPLAILGLALVVLARKRR